jgi:ActD protein
VAHTIVPAEEPAEVHPERRFLYGIIAEFEHAEDILNAARWTHEAGYYRMDAYTPFPVEGLSEELGHRDKYVPWIMLAGGVMGALGGFSFLYFTMVVDYPMNIGGRPASPGSFGWPFFIPITFEMTVLLSALSGVVGMFLINGLPMPYHPVFDAPHFERASSDRFFLCIEARDPRFDREETRKFLESLNPLRVSEVELRK